MGGLVLFFIPSTQTFWLWRTALGIACVDVALSFLLWLNFDATLAQFQFVEQLLWIPYLNLECYIGIDGISLFFVLLTSLLTALCILASWSSVQVRVKEYLIAFLFLEFFLLAVFCVLDLLLFYIFFESVLIPMFLIVVLWGSRQRKVRASYMLFFYTLIGSLVMLLAVLKMYAYSGTTNYLVLVTEKYPPLYQKLFWFAFFLSFAVKVPMVPFHIWLPEAHVEAPTAGSVILAGILLKLGTYGFLRFSLPLFPLGTLYFTPLVYTMAGFAVVYASLTAIRQTDMKRIIAYASVAHMNLVLIGMFSMNTQGLEGSVVQSLSHGLVASALFLCVGVVYDRHHTREVQHMGGLAVLMPLFVLTFVFFSMANIAFPGTSSFIGEFLLLAGAMQANTSATLLGSLGMVLSAAYSLWLLNRLSFGGLNLTYIRQFSDMSKREFFVFLPLILGTVVMGIYPEMFLQPIHVSVEALLQKVEQDLLFHGTGA